MTDDKCEDCLRVVYGPDYERDDEDNRVEDLLRGTRISWTVSEWHGYLWYLGNWKWDAAVAEEARQYVPKMIRAVRRAIRGKRPDDVVQIYFRRGRKP